MKFSKKTLLLIGIPLICICLGVKFRSLIDLSIKSMTLQVSDIVSNVKSDFVDISGYFRGIDYYINENQALRNEVKRLSSTHLSQSAYKSKIQYLNRLLGLKDNYEENHLSSVAAQVISFDYNNWGDTFKLDKGTDDKIAVGNFVVSDVGLIGKVSETYQHFCIVSAITNPLSSVAVRLRRNNLLGVVSGNVQHGVVLKVYGDVDDVNTGDVIETVDKGGILLGEVSQVYYENSEIWFKVKPAAEFSKLKEVLVLNED